VRVELYDLHGNMLGVAEGNPSATIDATQLPAGVYMARIQCNERLIVQRVTKI
jgi:hypothetical protein